MPKRKLRTTTEYILLGRMPSGSYIYGESTGLISTSPYERHSITQMRAAKTNKFGFFTIRDKKGERHVSPGRITFVDKNVEYIMFAVFDPESKIWVVKPNTIVPLESFKKQVLKGFGKYG